MLLSKTSRIAFAVTAAVSGVFMSNPSFAGPLPDAAFLVQAEGAGVIVGPGTLDETVCTTGPLGACQTSMASASPALTTSASGSTNGFLANSSGMSSILFYYEVVGPGNIAVPLVITGAVATSATGDNADAMAALSYDNNNDMLDTCSSTGLFSCPAGETASGSLDASYFLASNTADAVGVSASGASSFGTGAYSASADIASLRIAPGFLATHPGYSLEFSSNIIPTPEPSSWLILLAGSCGLLLTRSGRRRSTAA